MPLILPHLYLGTQRESRNESQLLTIGITHLLCVAESFRFPSETTFKYLHIPLSDEGTSNLSSTFQRCFDFIESSRQSGGKVFLFCRQAQNRSPSIAIAYLMSAYKKTLQDAYLSVQKEKSDISPHANYFKQLQKLDLDLFGNVSMSEADRGGSIQEMIRSFREENK